MSYDLCELEDCFYTDPYFPLSDSASNIDIFKTFQETNYNLNPFTNEILENPFDEIDQIAPTALSSSPPCHHLQSLSIYQMSHSLNHPSHLDIKTEQNKLPFYDYYVDFNSFMPHRYDDDGCDNSEKLMQRRLIESSNLQSMCLISPDHGFSSNHTRRVCSTGDLQSLETKQTLASSSLAVEGSVMEEAANFKVGRYGPEERKERILRYKAKRTQRNFNKTIKYACRKTLADNRPRIRGRFARNDEPEETLTFQRYKDEDELLMDGLHEVYNGVQRGHFHNTYMPITQFHRFSYFPI